MVSLHIPLDRLHAHRTDSGNDVIVVLPEWAANERRADAGDRLDLLVARRHIGDNLLGGKRIEVIVRVGVVHHLMSRVHDCLCGIGILRRPVANNEERRLDVVLFQYIENFLRVVRAPG